MVWPLSESTAKINVPFCDCATADCDTPAMSTEATIHARETRQSFMRYPPVTILIFGQAANGSSICPLLGEHL